MPEIVHSVNFYVIFFDSVFAVEVSSQNNNNYGIDVQRRANESKWVKCGHSENDHGIRNFFELIWNKISQTTNIDEK